MSEIKEALSDLGIDTTGLDAAAIKEALAAKLAAVATATGEEVRTAYQQKLDEAEANHQRSLTDSSVADEQLRVRNQELEAELKINRAMSSADLTAYEKEIITNWAKTNGVEFQSGRDGLVTKPGLMFGGVEVFSVKGVRDIIRQNSGRSSDTLPIQVVGRDKVVRTETQQAGTLHSPQLLRVEHYDNGSYGIVRTENGERKVSVIQSPEWAKK